MKQTVLFLSLIVAGIATIPLVMSDDDWHEYRQHSQGVASVSNPVYAEECGSCHMAFPAGLLPAPSWQKIMAGLEDHFGDNAELPADIHQQITAYLLENSADHSDYRRSRNITNSIPDGEIPVRITDTAYFRHEHDEIPDRMVKQNDKVRSFSNCNACHEKAEQGLFDEDNINIPGIGRWDD